MKVRWLGTPPDKCDLCSRPIGEFFIDGKTNQGPWAIMCEKCHDYYGYGLGVGRGQKYDRESLEKVEG